jgi:hypothetical protein
MSLVIGGGNAAAAPKGMTPLNAEELVRFLGFGDDAVQRMEQGEIVSVSEADLEGSKKGLAIALAMIIPHGIGDCTEAFAGPEMFRLDPGVLDFSRITIEDPAGSFSSVKFSAAETREAKNLISAKAGSEFNLASTDLERIRSAGNADGGMRKVLSTRFRSYVAKGLTGIEPYQRSAKSSASPAEELIIALDHSPMVETHLPQLHTYLRAYPASKPEGVEDRYYWVKRTVQDRPSFSLLHWTLVVEPEFAFLSEREFYVEHTYNSMQVFFGVLPFKNGVIVFYLNRTFTDQVAGFASGLAHKIGRGRMAEAITKNFEDMRTGLAK